MTGWARLRRSRTGANTALLIVERFATLTTGLLSGLIVARHLGPADFGQLGFATALLHLVVSIATAGFQANVVQTIVRRPEQRASIVGGVALIRLAGAGGTLVLLLVLAPLLSDSTMQARLIAIVAVASLSWVADASRMAFQAAQQVGWMTASRITAVTLGLSARIGLVVADAPLELFAVVIAAELLLDGALVTLFYRRTTAPPRWTLDVSVAKQLVRAERMLIVAGIASVINLRIDQAMLGIMRPSQDVAIYAVAARLSEVWYLVPTAVMTAAFPALLRLRSSDPSAAVRSFQHLYDGLVWAGITTAVVITVFSDEIIDLLYGSAYVEAALVLSIHVLTAPWLFMSIVFSRWIVAEGAFSQSLTRNIAGAAINVAANVILIPSYGARGAAVATLISYVTAHYLSAFVSASTRPAARQMTLALAAPLRYLPRPRGHQRPG